MTTGCPVWIPIRTRIGSLSHGWSASARCASAAATHGVRGVGEGEVEGVALHLDLDAAPRSEAVPEEPTVILEGPHVAVVAELLQQASRALDVGEEQGDRAARKLRHVQPGQAYDASTCSARSRQRVVGLTLWTVARANDGGSACAYVP